jgi:hypothetical protein
MSFFLVQFNKSRTPYAPVEEVEKGGKRKRPEGLFIITEL